MMGIFENMDVDVMICSLKSKEKDRGYGVDKCMSKNE